MTWVAKMLLVAVGCAIADFIFGRYQIALHARHRWRATGQAALLRGVSSALALLWIDDHRAIFAAALGDAIGTWFACDSPKVS